jgi:hypothetical protein
VHTEQLQSPAKLISGSASPPLSLFLLLPSADRALCRKGRQPHALLADRSDRLFDTVARLLPLERQVKTPPGLVTDMLTITEVPDSCAAIPQPPSCHKGGQADYAPRTPQSGPHLGNLEDAASELLIDDCRLMIEAASEAEREPDR